MLPLIMLQSAAFCLHCLNSVILLFLQGNRTMAHWRVPTDASVEQWEVYIYNEDSGLGNALGGFTEPSI